MSFNQTDKIYKRNLEDFLYSLLSTGPIEFRQIVCQAEGAYPTEILIALNALVKQDKIRKNDNRYFIKGKQRSTKQTRRKNFKTSTEYQTRFTTLDAESILSDPHPADYDWRYTLETRESLITRVSSMSIPKSKVALLGAPTLFLTMSRFKLSATLFDKSSSTISDLKLAGFNKELIETNLFESIIEHRGEFDVVVADPPWYLPFHKAFILRSSELLKKQGLLILSVQAWLTRPSALSDRNEIIKFATKAGFCLSEIIPGALHYQSPKFEKIALSTQGIVCGDWRVGDMFLFRKVSEANQQLNITIPSDEPVWDEYRFGSLKIKLRKKFFKQNGHLKIKSVSKNGPFLDNVSRRAKFRNKIDIWNSDNVAYSVSRTDLIGKALDSLRIGKSLAEVVNSLEYELTTDERQKLLALLENITSPIEETFLKSITLTQRNEYNVAKNNQKIKLDNSYVIKFLSEIIPGITDQYWQQRLKEFLLNRSKSQLHLAIFNEPYLQYILAGKKTVESRFSSVRFPPFEKVQSGDIVLLKRSSGPVVGVCEVGSVWFYYLDEESLKRIKIDFSEALCAQDPTFWEERRKAAYATLMRISHVQPINPTEFIKKDRRGWVYFNKLDRQETLDFTREQ